MTLLARAGILALVVVPSATFGASTLNLQPILDTLATKSSAGQANVLVFGDSLSVREGSYVPFFRTALQNVYGNAGQGFKPLSPSYTTGFYSGSWTYGVGNGDGPPYNALSGLWTEGSSGWGYIDPSSTKVNVQYAATPGGGSMELYLPDAQGVQQLYATLQSNASANSVQTLQLTLPTGTQRIYTHPVGDGPVTLLGMDDRSSATGVRLSVAANGGWTTGNFLNRNWTFDGSLAVENPDVAFIFLGQNDQNLYTASQFKDNLQAMADRITADAPGTKICLISPYGGTSGILQEYTLAEEELAVLKGYGFINLGELGGSYQYYADNGLLVDGVHFTAAGGQYVSDVLFNALMGGGSAAPEPTSLALLATGSTLLLRRKKQAGASRGKS